MSFVYRILSGQRFSVVFSVFRSGIDCDMVTPAFFTSLLEECVFLCLFLDWVVFIVGVVRILYVSWIQSLI